MMTPCAGGMLWFSFIFPLSTTRLANSYLYPFYPADQSVFCPHTHLSAQRRKEGHNHRLHQPETSDLHFENSQERPEYVRVQGSSKELLSPSRYYITK